MAHGCINVGVTGQAAKIIIQSEDPDGAHLHHERVRRDYEATAISVKMMIWVPKKLQVELRQSDLPLT
jgi:hypothetical protein